MGRYPLDFGARHAQQAYGTLAAQPPALPVKELFYVAG
jgi:hypothetical protein